MSILWDRLWVSENDRNEFRQGKQGIKVSVIQAVSIEHVKYPRQQVTFGQIKFMLQINYLQNAAFFLSCVFLYSCLRTHRSEGLNHIQIMIASLNVQVCIKILVVKLLFIIGNEDVKRNTIVQCTITKPALYTSNELSVRLRKLCLVENR